MIFFGGRGPSPSLLIPTRSWTGRYVSARHGGKCKIFLIHWTGAVLERGSHYRVPAVFCRRIPKAPIVQPVRRAAVFFFCDPSTTRERCADPLFTRRLGSEKTVCRRRGTVGVGKGRREGERKNRVAALKPAGGKPNNRRRRTDRPAGNGARRRRRCRTHTYTRQRRRRRRQRRTIAVCQSVVRVPLPRLCVRCLLFRSDRVTSVVFV